MTKPIEIDELRAKAELLDLLFSATQDGIVDWNLVSNRAEYNPRWKLLLGFDDGEFGQETPELWQELVHPDDREGVLTLLNEHLEQNWPFSTAVRMRHRAGGYRHILCRGTSHRDADERPLRMVIIFSDIDEKIRDEGRQRALVAALPDTLFRVRADGTISGIKRGRERDGSPFASLREGMTLGDSFGDARLLARLRSALLADVGLGPHRATTIQVASVAASGAPVHHEVRIVRSGEDESVCIVRDVTEQRDLEERLLETQKLGAIGQLAAGVAHEINTPMQFIGDNLHFAKGAVDELIGLFGRFKAAVRDAESQPLGAAKLAELSKAEADADFEYTCETLPSALERSLTGVERVTSIVRAMRSFAHPGADQLAPADLRGLIESTVMVATNEWRYVADVELKLEEGLPAVESPGQCLACHRRRGRRQRRKRSHYGQRAQRRNARRDQSHRYGYRHTGERPRQGVRAVLHDQGGRQGHGSGPVDGLQLHRQATPRHHRVRDRARYGNDIHRPSPAGRRRVELPSFADVMKGRPER
jgi:PAS domain S-box-containing protein